MNPSEAQFADCACRRGCAKVTFRGSLLRKLPASNAARSRNLTERPFKRLLIERVFPSTNFNRIEQASKGLAYSHAGGNQIVPR
jgi:hypothetical protein